MNYAKRIELEITLRCNQHCPTCNRHCNVYDRHSDSDMSYGQLQRFFSQVEERGDVWDTLAIMGGEPTLHEMFRDITAVCWKRLVQNGLVKKLQIWTNGKKEIDLDTLPVRYLKPDEESIEDGFIHIITADHSTKLHCQALMSPTDTGQIMRQCKMLEQCGIALNAYGYWPCGPGSAIARLFGIKGFSKDKLPADASEWSGLQELCSLCQHSCHTRIPLCSSWGEEPTRIISPTYQNAINTYRGRERFPKW